MLQIEVIILEKLKTNKYPGPDGIHPRVLKGLRCDIVDLLICICILPLNSAPVAEDWRAVNVT